jgi:hypothetical protein
MSLGTCRLCGSADVPIRDSHLLPKHFYKAAHGVGENPVYLRRERTLETSDQTTAPLLGDCCERRLSERGESWAAQNFWRDSAFPLREALEHVAGPEVNGHRECDARAAGVDVPRLVYLGASIFWRAGVHHWGSGATTATQIDLGPYEPALRRFLLDEQAFPKEMTLSVAVNAGAIASGVISLPIGGRAQGGFHSFKCHAPGVTFFLNVGKQIPREFHQMCIVRTGLVTLTARVDAWRIEGARELFRQSTVVGKLARTWPRR